METQTPETPSQQPQPQTIIVNPVVKQANGIGTAGFVIALLTLFLGWIPGLGWILWLLGLIFSAIGVTRKPRGLAVAGLIISLIGIICLLVVFSAVMSFFAVMS